MKLRLLIDVEASEDQRARLADLLAEQPTTFVVLNPGGDLHFRETLELSHDEVFFGGRFVGAQETHV